MTQEGRDADWGTGVGPAPPPSWPWFLQRWAAQKQEVQEVKQAAAGALVRSRLRVSAGNRVCAAKVCIGVGFARPKLLASHPSPHLYPSPPTPG